MRYPLQLLALLMLLVGCAGETAVPAPITPSAPTLLRLGVPHTVLPTLVTEPYKTQQPNVELQFIVGHPQTLLADLQTGQLDAIFTYRVPPQSDNWFNPVALDGLVIIQHPSQQTATYTTSDVVNLFARGDGYTVYMREEGSAIQTLFNQQVMQGNRATIHANILATDEAMQTAVATTPNAIGLSFLSTTTTDVSMVTLDGSPPTQNSVSTQTYPLTTPLYFYHATSDEPQEELRAFLAWLQSTEGQAILAEKFGRVR